MIPRDGPASSYAQRFASHRPEGAPRGPEEDDERGSAGSRPSDERLPDPRALYRTPPSLAHKSASRTPGVARGVAGAPESGRKAATSGRMTSTSSSSASSASAAAPRASAPGTEPRPLPPLTPDVINQMARRPAPLDPTPSEARGRRSRAVPDTTHPLPPPPPPPPPVDPEEEAREARRARLADLRVEREAVEGALGEARESLKNLTAEGEALAEQLRAAIQDKRALESILAEHRASAAESHHRATDAECAVRPGGELYERGELARRERARLEDELTASLAVLKDLRLASATRVADLKGQIGMRGLVLDQREKRVLKQEVEVREKLETARRELAALRDEVATLEELKESVTLMRQSLAMAESGRLMVAVNQSKKAAAVKRRTLEQEIVSRQFLLEQRSRELAAARDETHVLRGERDALRRREATLQSDIANLRLQLRLCREEAVATATATDGATVLEREAETTTIERPTALAHLSPPASVPRAPHNGMPGPARSPGRIPPSLKGPVGLSTAAPAPAPSVADGPIFFSPLRTG